MLRYSCAVAAIALSAGCDQLQCLLRPASFQLQVVPAEIVDAIPNQHCLLLVTVQEGNDAAGIVTPVQINATAPGATVLVENPTLRSGGVAEVTVIPQPLKDADVQAGGGIGEGGDDAGRTVTVTITGTRCGVTETATVLITVTSEEEDLVGPAAAEMRDLFIPWLAENQPALGITADTKWTGTIVSPHILVVTHYLFLSDEWEMHVYWHVMIPPYDWARIELRRRFEETEYSRAFEIPSVSAAAPLQAQSIEPEQTLWR